MLCTECYETRHADTLLEGSDLVEALGWLCFGVPGWLYCWWRHAVRIKVCSGCGGSSLVREARAAAAREPFESAEPRVRNLSGPIRWPRALATPRDRLREGGIGVLLFGALLGARGVTAAQWLSPIGALPLVCVLALLGGAWLIYELHRVVQMRSALPACCAWNDEGRPLPIEVL
jgi:hypothetical protein